MENKFSNLIFWGIALILFLPIIILPPEFQPSDWTRFTLLRIILTSLMAYLAYRFLYKKDFSFSLPKWNIWLYLPVLMILGFWAVSIISTIFSQDRFFSVFGSPTRAGGLLNLSFIIIFALLIPILVKKEHWDKLMRVNFAAGVLASFLAIVQYFGLFKNIFLGFETGATPSFLGNSTFLAMYMIFLVFSSLNFLILKKTKKEKVVYGLLFLLFLFTIFVTNARASYIGLLLGFAFLTLFYPKYLLEDNAIWLTPKRLKIFKIASFSLIMLVLAVLLYVNLSPKLPGFIENNKRLSYFVHQRLSFNIVWQDLTGTRVSVWKTTLKAIRERPLLGWGPENFHIGFEKYFDPTLPPSLQRLWWDRPHNILLEIWANSGIFALLLYIAFWFALFWQLQKAKKISEGDSNLVGNLAEDSTKKSYIAHGLQAMFIAYLVVLFFNFDSFSTYLISYFFIGYAFYIIALDKERKVIMPLAQKLLMLKPLVVALFLLIILFFWFWGFKPLYLNEKIVEAKNLSDGKKCQKAFEVANSSNWEKAGIIRPYTALIYSDIMTKCTFAKPEKEKENAKKAFDLLNTASKIQTKYSRTWLFMASMTNILAAREQNKENKEKLVLEAKEYLAKALELSPKRQEILLELEKTHLITEDIKAMEKTAYDCLAIDPARAECYWYLGISQILMGKQEEGKKNIALSKEKGYNDPPYIQLGVAYIKQKNYKDAVEVYQTLIALHPKNADYHAALALLFKEIGNFEKARLEAMEVFRLQPDNPETIEFIKLLIGLEPGDVTLLYALVDIYKTLGETEKLEAELLKIVSFYQQLIEKEPNNFFHHINLANTYKELTYYEKAYQEAIIALETAPQKVKEVEYLLNKLPPEYLIRYENYVRSKPSLFFQSYGNLPGSLKK